MGEISLIRLIIRYNTLKRFHINSQCLIPKKQNILKKFKIKKLWQDAQHHQKDIEQPAELLLVLPVEDVLADIVHIQNILHLTHHIAVVMGLEVQEVVNQDGRVLHLVFIIPQLKFGL